MRANFHLLLHPKGSYSLHLPTLPSRNHLKSECHTAQESQDLHKAIREAHANGLLHIQCHTNVTMPKLSVKQHTIKTIF